jgi:phage protein D
VVDEPVEELRVLRGGRRARERLHQVVVRVDHARDHDAAARVEHARAGLVQVLADGHDDAAADQNVRVRQFGAGVVHRRDAQGVLDQQGGLHGVRV